MTWVGTRSPVIPEMPAWLASADLGSTAHTAPFEAGRLGPKLQLFRWALWHWSRRPEVRAVALDISRGAPDLQARLNMIAWWVNDHVAYVEEAGEIIELPGWTIRHGAADCDGHTLLLGALLGGVGLDVWPFIVFKDRVPIHVCVGFQMSPSGDKFWVDTTIGDSPVIGRI